ncbi:MAG: hypothetical protein Q8P67_07125, partial [archaeon]|nr:hypothetical protein [archaeon]
MTVGPGEPGEPGPGDPGLTEARSGDKDIGVQAKEDFGSKYLTNKPKERDIEKKSPTKKYN